MGPHPCACCDGTAVLSRRAALVSIVALGTGAILPGVARSQSVLTLSETSGICGINAQEERQRQVVAFASSKEAREIVDKICKLVNLQQNFTIVAADVPNAQAEFIDKKRYILYSEVWVQKMMQSAVTKYSGYALMAHECAHHFNDHIFVPEKAHTQELAADQFAGFIVRKFGGSLEEALAMYRTDLFSDEPSTTHPGRKQRLEAVAVGWRNANESDSSAQCVNRWIGKQFQSDGRTCRQFIACVDGDEIVKTACQGQDGTWTY